MSEAAAKGGAWGDQLAKVAFIPKCTYEVRCRSFADLIFALVVALAMASRCKGARGSGGGSHPGCRHLVSYYTQTQPEACCCEHGSR